jgi:hypothetical protein
MLQKAAVASLFLLAMSGAALADSTVGTVLAFDRQALLIVLEDKTVWSLEGSDATPPADLKAGDRIEIDFLSAGDDGITKIQPVKLAEQ